MSDLNNFEGKVALVTAGASALTSIAVGRARRARPQIQRQPTCKLGRTRAQ